MKYYVYQHPKFCIGNFIYCTPSIRILYDHFKEKVPVLFSTEVVSSLYADSKFIKPINSKQSSSKTLICSSHWVQSSHKYIRSIRADRNNLQEVADKFIVKPDWEHLANLTMKELNINRKIPHTFIDKCRKPDRLRGIKNYGVMLRGCATHVKGEDGQGVHFDLKDPGVEIYKYIIDDLNSKGVRTVFLGAQNNKENIKEIAQFANDPIIILDDIRKSLGAINRAKFIISNDTGLYHAAAALNKKTFILWKNTPFAKNRSPGAHNTFSQRGHWMQDYLDWTEQGSIL